MTALAVSATYFQDLYVETTVATTRPNDAYVFFHGFPGGTIHNEDVAKAVANQTGAATHVVHFGGLGKGKGEFGFLKSIEQSMNLMRNISSQQNVQRIHLFGHSWGGLVAVNAAMQVEGKLGALFLVSPYSGLPDSTATRHVLGAMKKSDPLFPANLDIEGAVKDVATISNFYNPFVVVKKIRPLKTYILQAQNDDEVPASVNRAFAPMFSPEATYLEVNQNHSFTNRAELISQITNWLRHS